MAALPELELSSRPAKLNLRVLPSSSGTSEEEEEECRTPTSKESKIPIIPNCPAGPKKKQNFSDFSKKRRLSERELIRVNSDLLERLFRPLKHIKTPPVVLKNRKRCYPG